MPLLIGGATTSRAHTALKIEPHYKSPTVWVKDASRAVGVAQSLISQGAASTTSSRANDADYAEIRERHKRPRRRQDAWCTLEKARAQRFDGDWATTRRRRRSQPGITVFDDYPLAELVDCIDWTPFFKAWELAGRYPAILDDAVVGEQARELFAMRATMLDSDRRGEVADRATA